LRLETITFFGFAGFSTVVQFENKTVQVSEELPGKSFEKELIL
jgi:hypothetical protein